MIKEGKGEKQNDSRNGNEMRKKKSGARNKGEETVRAQDRIISSRTEVGNTNQRFRERKGDIGRGP